jgi:hypothetical protein
MGVFILKKSESPESPSVTVDDLPTPVAVDAVVVDHAGRLHVGAADGGEAARPRIAAQMLGLNRGGGGVGQGARSIDDRAACSSS